MPNFIRNSHTCKRPFTWICVFCNFNCTYIFIRICIELHLDIYPAVYIQYLWFQTCICIFGRVIFLYFRCYGNDIPSFYPLPVFINGNTFNNWFFCIKIFLYHFKFQVFVWFNSSRIKFNIPSIFFTYINTS